MDRNFETGKHQEITRICAYSECGMVYVAQLGGQKSGSSPAIHIKEVGKSPVGYCSTECLYLANGWSMEAIRQHYQDMGLNYDEICPKRYLAPARRVNGQEPLDIKNPLR